MSLLMVGTMWLLLIGSKLMTFFLSGLFGLEEVNSVSLLSLLRRATTAPLLRENLATKTLFLMTIPATVVVNVATDALLSVILRLSDHALFIARGSHVPKRIYISGNFSFLVA